MKISKLLFIFLLSLTTIVFSEPPTTNICRELIGEWNGTWDDLEHVQRATIRFLVLQAQQFRGLYNLEGGQQAQLNGSCTQENDNSGYLVFDLTPPLYNPCYGKLVGDTLAIWCLNPNQSGIFQKIY
jgi:hypothetical protein